MFHVQFYRVATMGWSRDIEMESIGRGNEYGNNQFCGNERYKVVDATGGSSLGYNRLVREVKLRIAN
jgi:hypothetical protein